MRRVIEDLIEKRKKAQSNLKKSLTELGASLGEKSGFFKKKDEGIKEKFEQLSEDIHELITIQDREWDAYSNNHKTQVFKSLQWKIDKLQAEYSQVKNLLTNFIHLEDSLKRLIDTADSKSADKLQELKAASEAVSPHRYSDFEQRYRGAEESVTEKLVQYLPHFESREDILDIGCGRGEFLELLKEKSIRSRGIDMSESMLEIARSKDLDCSYGDALGYLETLEAGSLGGIFSSQVIEHLTPDYLRDMVLQCRRTLKKGAPVILETVNPLSLFALSNIYFLDITHQKPLHPEYMRYLLETSGFENVEILYSDEPLEEKLEEISPDMEYAKVYNSNIDKLNKTLYSSQVYAVKGIKV